MDFTAYSHAVALREQLDAFIARYLLPYNALHGTPLWQTASTRRRFWKT